jgi:putative transcriptional regulator
VANSSLAPSLLLAMPDLLDPNFRRTVVLLVHHDEEGTVGLVLNRTTEVTAADLCQTLDVEWRGETSQIVHWGGPVQENTGWVVAGEAALAGVPAATAFAADLHFAGSLEALRRVAEETPARLRLFLGYSGWGAGQLEEELARGAWVVAPLAPEAIFEISPDELWDYAWSLLGVDPATVVSTPGVH